MSIFSSRLCLLLIYGTTVIIYQRHLYQRHLLSSLGYWSSLDKISVELRMTLIHAVYLKLIKQTSKFGVRLYTRIYGTSKYYTNTVHEWTVCTWNSKRIYTGILKHLFLKLTFTCIKNIMYKWTCTCIISIFTDSRKLVLLLCRLIEFKRLHRHPINNNETNIEIDRTQFLWDILIISAKAPILVDIIHHWIRHFEKSQNMHLFL